jgi:hypothetical protein
LAAAAERTQVRVAFWPECLRVAAGSPALTAALAVAALMLPSLGVRIWLAGRIATPWIMIDELIYSEMAKSFASSGQFWCARVRVGSSACLPGLDLAGMVVPPDVRAAGSGSPY